MNRLALLIAGALVLVLGIALFLGRDVFWRQPSAVTAVSKLAGEAERAAKRRETEKAEERRTAPASGEPAATGGAPRPEGAAKPAEEASSAPAARRSGATPPTFDVVRVEPTGEAVIAGRAAPGAVVEVVLDGKVVGTVKAGADGAWTFVPERPLFTGSHQLTLRAKAQDREIVSVQTLAVSMAPVKKGEAPLVVLAEPNAPSRVLQQPKPAAPTLEKRVATAAAPRPAEGSEEKGSVTTTAPEAHKARPAEEPPAREGTTAPATPAKPTPETTPEKATAEKATKAEKETAAERKTPAATKPAPALALRTVDYDETGQIFFTGRASPGAALRLYVDNRYLADVRADENGAWTWRGKTAISPGRHALRVDRLAANGRVMERIELPFVRAEVRAVAEARAAAGRGALLEKLKREAAEGSGEETAPAKPAMKATPAGGGAEKTTSTGGGGTAEKAASAPGQAAETGPDSAAPAGAESARRVAKAEPTEETPAPVPQRADTGAVEKTANEPRETSRAEDKGPKAGFIVVQPGNNLWNISRVIYGRGVRYTTIYEANRDQIRDPDLIYPGQVFRAPGLPPKKIAINPRRRKPLSPEELEKAPVAVQ